MFIAMLGRIRPQAPIYNLHQLVGEGLTSWVYKAFREDPQSGLKELVALKILKSKKYVENWRKELLILKKLRSKNCVRYYGWERIKGCPALVLEFIQGVSLEELIQNQTLSFFEINEITRQCLIGLCDLKQIHVCHGDLSLKNIVIDKEGVIKLLDFGVFNSHKGQRQLTLDYAAPEVVSGNPPTFTSDLFALGKVREKLLIQSGYEVDDNHTQSLLKISVDDRKTLKITKNKKAVKSLSEKVRITQSRLENPLSDTPTVLQKKPRRWKEPVRVALLVSFIFLCGQWGHGMNRTVRLFSRVSIRTAKWHKIQINSTTIGYTPINDLFLPKGAYEIFWIRDGESGRTALTIKEEKHIVLDDSFFKN